MISSKVTQELAIERQRATDGTQSMREIQRAMKQKLNDAMELTQHYRRQIVGLRKT